MNLNRWLTILLMSIFSTVALFADQTEDLRKKLAQTKGPERITILQNLYDLSLEFDDLDYQLRCINQLIDECQKQDATLRAGTPHPRVPGFHTELEELLRDVDRTRGDLQLRRTDQHGYEGGKRHVRGRQDAQRPLRHGYGLLRHG